MPITLDQNLRGRILDVGGGGEGVIGRRWGRQVTAIDNRQEELDEAPDCCEKRLMDAAALDFPDAAFDHVTCFFSLLFMDRDTQAQAIREAVRVLRSGGCLHIWDTPVVQAAPEPFLIDLDIDIAGTPLHTTYGIIKEDAAQSAAGFTAMAKAAGLTPEAAETDGRTFYLRFYK